MISCVAAVVRVMPHEICGVSIRSVSVENGSGGSSPGCICRLAQSMVRPSSRGGVPVFSRPSANPSRSSVVDRPMAGRFADAAGRRLVSPMWISPRRNVPVVSTTAPASRTRGHRPSLTPVDPAIGDRQIVGLAFDHGQIGGLADRPLHGGGVELAVGLRARAAHRRALAAVEHAELDAALVGDPAHQAVERVDLADQMALAEPADRRIAGHGADGREPMRHQRGFRAHARRRGRGFTAGVAAADHDDVESRIHRKCLEWRAFSGARRERSKAGCFT